MALLRLASDATTNLPIGDDETDFITVRADISKRTFNKLIGLMPDVEEGATLTIEQGLTFQRDLFETFVVGWSLDTPPTVDAYLDLEKTAADAVDVAIGKHFEGLSPDKDDATKSA